MSFSDIVLNGILNNRGKKRLFWSLIRKFLLKINAEMPCSATIHNRQMALPFSHELPIYLKNYPLYDSLIGRVSQYLKQMDNNLIMVDVGANIGDSIIASSPNNTDHYLAIEPSDNFVHYLKQNLNGINYELVQCFLTDNTGKDTNYTLQESRGTARIIQSDSKETANNTNTLDDVICQYPQFFESNFLKVDTDGFDLKVLGGSDRVLSALPMVLFECDDFGQANFVDNVLAQMDKFAQLGYQGYLIYDNFGVLMANFDFSAQNRSNFKNLLQFKLISQHFYYFDVLVYPQKYQSFIDKEKTFFDNQLNGVL